MSTIGEIAEAVVVIIELSRRGAAAAAVSKAELTGAGEHTARVSIYDYVSIDSII